VEAILLFMPTVPEDHRYLERAGRLISGAPFKENGALSDGVEFEDFSFCFTRIL
jgi:hypothetical protein